MSSRFAERAHRRATGAPPLDDIDSQIDHLDASLAEMARTIRGLAREVRSARAALAELRADVATRKPQDAPTAAGARPRRRVVKRGPGAS